MHSSSRPATAIVSPPSSRWSGTYERPGTPAGANCAYCSSRSRSPSGMYTGAPVPSARSATPPRWSKWPCVIRIAAHAAPLRASCEPQLGGVAARVDDGRLRRTALGAQHVAVRLQRPEGVAIDDEAHAGECNGVHV